MPRFYVRVWDHGAYDERGPGALVAVNARDENDAEDRVMQHGGYEVTACEATIPRTVTAPLIRRMGIPLINFRSRRKVAATATPSIP